MKDICHYGIVIYNTIVLLDPKEDVMNSELKVGDRIVVVNEVSDKRFAGKGTKGVITSIGPTYVSFDTDNGVATRKMLFNVRQEDFE